MMSADEDRLAGVKELNPDLMNPKRFLIITFLYLFGPKTMAELQRALRFTWGDLDSNLKRLKGRGYVELKKVFTLRGPRTMVSITEKGVKEYERLVDKLRDILTKVRTS
ncbi:MAG: ArsR family transcriptional regulator [Thermoprotei archaeon]|nr:MAG: ArsR family transcriptional regulator [Thermoprotei archaeon]